ncbi:hypothetical protein JCM14124_05480 [Humidesulfovibrio idahonensis]
MTTEFDLRYSDTLLPMLSEADGYFHLAQSQQMLSGRIAWAQAPLLSVLGASVHLATRQPIEIVAFWLPVAIATFSGLLFWGWGKLLALPQSGVLAAAFLGAFIPAVLERGGPGWYDTDPGVFLLFHGALLATAWVSFAPGRPRTAHVGWLLACIALLGWWWRPGMLALPLCLLLWGGSFALAQSRPWQRRRLVTGFAVVVACGLCWVLPDSMLPQAAATLRGYFFRHADISLSGSRALVFSSIDELEPLGAADVLDGLGGGLWTGGAALVAVALMLWRRPRCALFFVPSLLCIGLSFYAKRFLFLAGLPVALGVGLLPETLPSLGLLQPVFLQAQGRTRVKNILGWGVCLLVLAGCVHNLYVRPLHFIFQRPQDRLALALRQAATADARLWNWWDDGYFLAARSGHAPLFDGGSQTPRMCFIAAHPLVSTDPQFARRWIRFFALRGEAGLDPLRAAWGDEAVVWRRLEAVFSAPDPLAALAEQPPGPKADWLFPQGRVFLYLPQRFLNLSKWWFAMGASPVPDARTLRPHIDVFDRTGFSYASGDAQVLLPDAAVKKGYRKFGGVFETGRAPLAPPWGGGNPGPYVVVSDVSPWLYIVDEDAIGSVGFRLLAPGGPGLPGFAPVLVDHARGGVWEVLP